MTFTGASAVLKALDALPVTNAGPTCLDRATLSDVIHRAGVTMGATMHTEAMEEFDQLIKPECGRRSNVFTNGKEQVRQEEEGGREEHLSFRCAHPNAKGGQDELA